MAQVQVDLCDEVVEEHTVPAQLEGVLLAAAAVAHVDAEDVFVDIENQLAKIGYTRLGEYQDITDAF